MAAKKKKAPAKKPAAKKASSSSKKSTLRNTAEERAAALPSETAEENPNEPVAQLVAYANRTVELAAPVASQLAKLHGFDAVCFTDLKPGASLLIDAEAKWSAARAKSRAGVSPERVKEAAALKSEITEAARYLLRKDPVAQQELDQILEGTGVADLALDLERLASLVERNADVFAEVLDADIAAQARTLAAGLGKGITPNDAAELQARRNRLFHLVQSDLREVLAALRFHWRKKPTQLAQLGVTYAAQLQRGSRARKKTPAPAT